ncbi:MAG: AI-2E family transporter [Candidatus Omnitrophica bacterium]|nr:AI-2E family transporter [Candidatus Omnitrophota bacterium]
MTRDQFISLFFIALLIFVIYEIVLIFSPFAKPIFWSAILGFGFFPLYERLRKSLKPRETLAAILMTFIIFLLVIPPFVFLVVTIAREAIEFYQSASTYIQEGNLENLIERIRSLPFIQKIETGVFQWEPLKQNAREWILNSTKAVGNFTAAQAGTITKNVFVLSFQVLMMTFLLFVFLKDGEKIYRFIYDIAPLEERNKKSIFGQMNETFAAVIRGQLLTSLTQAIVAGIVFLILNIPLAIFFAAVTFLTGLIPVVGASAVWLPLVIYLITEEQHVRAAILFIIGLLVISLIDNVMKPALIGEKTKLPYFLLFFGILGGFKLYGLMGIFIAPVVLSVFFALVKIYQEKYL